MKKIAQSLPVRLLAGVIIGIAVGLISNESFMNIIVTVKHLLGQVITFCVPLIVIGFIAPSITRLGKSASRMLSVALVLAYTSSVGAALSSMAAGYTLIPHLSIVTDVDGLKELPEMVFELSIPQIMPVMSALVFSIMIGLAAAWNKAKLITGMLEEFQKIVLSIVSRILIPILPLFIGFTFCSLAYEGSITKQLPVFLKVIIIVMIGHYIWMALLYTIAGAYSGKNPLEVVKHYGPAYLTAVGTMSSAATLGVALQCAGKAKPLRKDMVQFGIPLFANIHLCGSVLTEVFFCMTISQILYGKLPSIPTMLLFCILLGVFAIGAPGVPGGAIMAALGLLQSMLGFNETLQALMIALYIAMDSFGTACNVTGDGAIAIVVDKIAGKQQTSPDITE